jgi:exodeoxyribonuclease-1
LTTTRSTIPETLFFYDLETSGLSAREDRIMQFAGQRTSLDLEAIGEPVNELIKLGEDVLPEPGAILVTGITPQQTIADGLTEVEFLELFYKEVAIPGTIFVGYNSVRFDDEFMRFLNYRNFYDSYEWQWSDGRSRWDLLDVVRMTRALRPDGIKWPSVAGKATNKLELLAKSNKLTHVSAHDALSDVTALIELTRLIKTSQPKLYQYLFETMRDKKKVADLVNSGQPFIYTSSKYDGLYEKTTAACALVPHPKRQGVIVYDLRNDPKEMADLTVEEMLERWRPGHPRELGLPIKALQFNRCPAVAPLGVLDTDSQRRIDLDLDTINKNFKALQSVKESLSKKVTEVLNILEEEQTTTFAKKPQAVDAKLYDGFFSDSDRQLMMSVRHTSPEDLDSAKYKFSDGRLISMLPLYKARNYPKLLSQEERADWDKYKQERLLGGKENSKMAKFFTQLNELKQAPKLSERDRYLIEELELYAQSMVPADLLS